MNKVINAINEQGFKNVRGVINCYKHYKAVLMDGIVLTINKNTLDIVHIYQDLTKGDK